MKFWDTSAIVPLLVKEERTSFSVKLHKEDSVMVVWWGTPVECVSAIARLEREGALSSVQVSHLIENLNKLGRAWHEVQPVDDIRDYAQRFLRVHPLRSANALQLAAAFLTSEGKPSTLEFVTLDQRLADAARKEGFVVRSI